MTGGGFGGCTINIVRNDSVENFSRTVAEEYRAATGIDAEIYLVRADDGAREEFVSEPGAVASGSNIQR
jgi:galactokinase